jgi:hypothetical protein
VGSRAIRTPGFYFPVYKGDEVVDAVSESEPPYDGNVFGSAREIYT